MRSAIYFDAPVLISASVFGVCWSLPAETSPRLLKTFLRAGLVSARPASTVPSQLNRVATNGE